MLDYMQGPIWISDVETGEPLSGINIVDNDEILKKLNLACCELYNSCYEFNKHCSSCWFDEQKLKCNKDELMSSYPQGKLPRRCIQKFKRPRRVCPFPLFDKDKPFFYEFTACLVAQFAKQHDLLEIMPTLCNPDYTAMELIHARLVRKTTCSNGDKCDYTVCGESAPVL